MDRRSTRFVFGCLLGGAVGDALGAPVEFISLGQIHDRYGETGITDFDELNYKGKAEFTDDTQMTLFTSEGLLIASEQAPFLSEVRTISAVHRAYLRWLETQSVSYPGQTAGSGTEGWLLQSQEMWKIRAPGNTCLSALRSREIGTPGNPLNNSKGCGGVMRAAPAGLFFQGKRAFEEGVTAAAITHGHPSGYLSAGCLAQIVAEILPENPAKRDSYQVLRRAIEKSVKTLVEWAGHEETLEAVRRALDLAGHAQGSKSAEAVETLGGGWTGEEALAIALYCALVFPDDFQKALILSVNHSGDSDSTGAICGNLLGTLLGVEAIPVKWRARIEMYDEIEQVAQRIANVI